MGRDPVLNRRFDGRRSGRLDTGGLRMMDGSARLTTSSIAAYVLVEYEAQVWHLVGGCLSYLDVSHCGAECLEVRSDVRSDAAGTVYVGAGPEHDGR